MKEDAAHKPSMHVARRQPDSWAERLREAKQAAEQKEWSDASELWFSIFHDAADRKQRRRAGRQAATASRKAENFERAREVIACLITEFPEDTVARRELGRLETRLNAQATGNRYWSTRQRLFYVQVAKEISLRIASNANSVVDVGSKRTPILSWFPSVPVKVSVDLNQPYEADGVDSVRKDFLKWDPGVTFDVGLCFQVIEHVPDARAFARQMLELFDVSIVSVPYLWREDRHKNHVHDPVERRKLESWFGREPNYSYKIKELHGDERLICVYDRESSRSWPNVNEGDFRYRWTLRGAEAVIGEYWKAQMRQEEPDEPNKHVDSVHAELQKARRDAANARARLERLQNRRSVRLALRLAELAAPLARRSGRPG